jgi:serine/threonine protein kinase
VRALPEVGDQIAGYRIERQLGRGGMGVVYLAEQTRLRRLVALKLIAPELAEDDEFRRRFERESQLAASLDHPNVIPVYEAGEADGALFISMRFVDGDDLRVILRREQRLEAARAVGLIAQLASALDAAHAGGLVHRDVKPANVLVTGRPGSEHAYLTDFGLTKHVSSSSGITHTGQWVGTLDYVAPEQISGGVLDARVDVYSLGCVLHEALTGQVPYPRESDVAKMYAHLNDPPRQPSQVVPGVPPALDGVVARAMAKTPEGRYPSAGDLGRAAATAAAGQVNTVPERSVAAGEAAPTRPKHQAAATEVPTAQLTSPTEQLPRSAPQTQPQPPYAQPEPWAPPPPAQPEPRRRSAWPFVAVAGVLLLLGGVAAALVATGAFEKSDSKQTTVIVRETTPAATDEGTPTDTGPTGPATDPPPESATYQGATYAADYPAGWTIVSDEDDKGAYTETKLQSPDGDATVVIDRTPGSPVDPETAARGVERETAKTPGYVRISFGATDLGGRDGFQWVFELPSGRRVDFFTNAGGGRFAVLGHGSDYASAEVAARMVAESLR